MNILKIKRGDDLLQTLYYDLTDGNFFLVLVDELPDVSGQPVVYVPERINILMAVPKQFSMNEAGHFLPALGSQTVRFQTLWRKLALSNAGLVIESLNSNAGNSMEANEVDGPDFIALQGLPIVFAMTNGRIRSIEGYNYLPVFDNQGAFISYTQEQIAAAVRTHDYRTHNADGSPIHPELFPVLDPEPEAEPIEEIPTETVPVDEGAPE